MFKIAKYVLLLVVVSACCASCASHGKVDFEKRKKRTAYHPNLRKPPSGMTDNCDCAKGGKNRTSKRFRNRR